MLPRSLPQDSLPAGRSLYRRDKTPTLSTGRSLYRREEIHLHPSLVRCVSVRRLPVGRLPVGRLPVGRVSAFLWTLVLYAAFVVLEHLVCRSYSSGSDWYPKIFYPFLPLERTRRLWWSVSLTAIRSDVRGLPGCILLGVAASRYTTFQMQHFTRFFIKSKSHLLVKRALFLLIAAFANKILYLISCVCFGFICYHTL
jgi:hypothetical protein